MSKPKLLYISWRWPARTGGGSSMRGGMLVEALAAHYDVHLLIVNAKGFTPGQDADALSWCTRIEYLPVAEFQSPDFQGVSSSEHPERLLAAERSSELTFLQSCSTPGAVALAYQAYSGVSFDTVLICRLCLVNYAEPYLRLPAPIRPRLIIDLDDFESKTHLRLAALSLTAGDTIVHDIHLLEAEKNRRLEQTWLPLFDEVWLCSEPDCAELQSAIPHPGLRAIPNAVRIPTHPNPQPSGARPPVIFFIGQLAYYPNQDALLHFQSEILPHIRRSYGRPFRFLVAGAGASDVPARLQSEPEFEFAGHIPDVAPYYAQADVVIAPIRAGGGTRIKILEAFAFQKPVVATPLAAEGLEVTHGAELLLAAAPLEFAESCTALLEDPALRATLTRQAFDFVRARHSLQFLTALLGRNTTRLSAPAPSAD